MAEPEERNIFANYHPSVRGQIIGMHSAGMPQHEICNRIGCNRKTVSLWIRRHAEGGTNALVDHRKKNKRPLKTTPEEDVELCEYVEDNPFTTIPEALETTGIPICVNTARSRLKSVGVTAHRPVKKIPLTENHRQQRLLFAEEHLLWTPQQWAKVVWSDEKVSACANSVINKQIVIYNKLFFFTIFSYGFLTSSFQRKRFLIRRLMDVGMFIAPGPKLLRPMNATYSRNNGVAGYLLVSGGVCPRRVQWFCAKSHRA